MQNLVLALGKNDFLQRERLCWSVSVPLLSRAPVDLCSPAGVGAGLWMLSKAGIPLLSCELPAAGALLAGFGAAGACVHPSDKTSLISAAAGPC